MKHTLLIAVGLLALAGCNNPEPVTPPAAENTGTTATSETVPAVCHEQSGYEVFPETVNLAIPYHLRGDRIYTHKDGQQRRRVTIEYLEGDANDALAALEQSMIAAGFKAGPQHAGADGKITMSFSKRESGAVYVSALPTPGPNPNNPAAKGMISIDYSMSAPQVPSPEATNG